MVAIFLRDILFCLEINPHGFFIHTAAHALIVIPVSLEMIYISMGRSLFGFSYSSKIDALVDRLILATVSLFMLCSPLLTYKAEAGRFAYERYLERNHNNK